MSDTVAKGVDAAKDKLSKLNQELAMKLTKLLPKIRTDPLVIVLVTLLMLQKINLMKRNMKHQKKRIRAGLKVKPKELSKLLKKKLLKDTTMLLVLKTTKVSFKL